MKITALIENASERDELSPQYGLSLFVETAHGSIVVDAGQDGTAYDNFCTMGFDREAIDALVASHNHFDHIGGMQTFLDATAARRVPLYLSAQSKLPLVSKRFLHRARLVSRSEVIEQNEDRCFFVEDAVQILLGAFACRVKTPDLAYSCQDKKLKMLNGAGRRVPDDFRHEIYLAVIEDGAVKIVSPCSHNGAVNIIRDAEERFSLPVRAFIGGLHLRGSSSDSLNCSKRYLSDVAARLNELLPDALYTCHCTGRKAFLLLKEQLACNVQYFHTGDSFRV